MAFGFQKPYPRTFEAWTLDPDGPPDGRNFRFLEPLIYLTKSGKLIRSEIGGLTDGGSVPRETFNILAPFDWWMAFSLHDFLYKDQVELYAEANQAWNHCTFDEAEANLILDEALESRGCPFLERIAIFDALKAFGKTAFNDDRTSAPMPTKVPC